MPSTVMQLSRKPARFPGRLSLRAAAALAIVAASIAPVRSESPEESRHQRRAPNIVILLADDLGYGDIGCYGSTKVKTPHLDRLAAGGMRFSDFHSSGPVCSPTRAGLVTGRYQQRAGIPGVINADPKVNRNHGLHTSEVTFAELMKDAGYATAVCGKWHLGYEKPFNPRHHGFDVFHGYVSGNIDYISHYDRMEIYDWWHDLKTVEEPGYSTHLISRHAVEFIDANQDRPFCLYVAHEAPHSPYQGPGDPPERGPHKVDVKQTKQDIARARREMIEEMDKGVGDVIAALERNGLRDNTLVFFFSDNGAERNGDNGPLRGFKGSLWEGGHRVPAIGSWPGVIEAGTTNDSPNISIDVMATILELGGAKLPKGHQLDGRSLLPLLKGESSDSSPRQLYWQYGAQGAMRDGDWKLVLSGKEQPSAELFDLSKDLAEAKNLATKHPDRLEKMKNAYYVWLKDVETGATKQPQPGAKAPAERDRQSKASAAEKDVEVAVIRDVEYARPDDKPQLLDLYRPREAAGPLPVVVWIHGGGWINGSKANPPARWLAEQGYAVASINYRLTGEAQWPAQIDDCRAAVRWLRTHADEYGLDADHIGAWGGSAGGHLAALLATLDAPKGEAVSSRVQAVCDWYGPADLLTMPNNTPAPGKTAEDLANTNGAKLLGGTVRDRPELAKQASALYQLSKDDPPMLIMHGDRDPGVPISQSKRLHAQAQKVGVKSTLHIVEGAGHGGKQFQSAEVRDLVREFFDRHLRNQH